MHVCCWGTPCSRLAWQVQCEPELHGSCQPLLSAATLRVNTQPCPASTSTATSTHACMQALVKGQRLIVDLSFEDKMTDAELKSLCQQLAYCYSANARSSKPMHLIFTGVQGRMKECINKQCSGFDNWIATKSEATYLVHFKEETEQLVYLTADSENEIQELDPSKIYIVGGIVDRNRYKNLCAGKAEEEGIATAKLPIGDYVALSSSSVMCTNHVVEIMIRQQELGDWRAAFEAVIPTRKRKAGDTSDAVPEDNIPAVKEEPCAPASAPAPQKQKKDKAAVKGAAATKPRKETASVGK
uniref:tRNA (guanine(9)-N(1))-methyltransferase n=1 Tax=Auxenochlorella protothecoides TaxID=3075 RepID=A0A1D1ZQL9_AUXPR